MQNIGEQQLLMLLLMMTAKFYERPDRRVQWALKQTRQRLIDVLAIATDFLERGPRQQPALRARMAGANCFVIGVEEERIARLELSILRVVRHQDHGLEKPGRMRQVPLRRTRIRHGLCRGIGV